MADQDKSTQFVVPCQLVGTEGTLSGTILNANTSHIIVNTGAHILHTHANYQVKFTVPDVDLFVDAEAVVMKTRDEWAGSTKNTQVGIHFAELVFKKLTPDQARAMGELALKYLTGKG